MEVVDSLCNVIKKERETAKITTRANPTASDILGLDETVLYNPRDDFFIKSQFLFVSFMIDFCKIVLEEIAKARTNVGFNSPIFAHAATFMEVSAVNYFLILGKLWEKSLHLKIVVTSL